jgi:hypothetical protein
MLQPRLLGMQTSMATGITASARRRKRARSTGFSGGATRPGSLLRRRTQHRDDAHTRRPHAPPKPAQDISGDSRRSLRNGARSAARGRDASCAGRNGGSRTPAQPSASVCVPRSRALALTSRNRIRQTRPARPVLHARRAVRAIVQATVRAVGWIEALVGRGVAIVGGGVHAAIVPNERGAQ